MFKIFDIIWSIVAAVEILLLSVVFVIIDFWLIFVPIKYRNRVARYVLIVPWCWTVNTLVYFMRLKVSGKEYLDRNRTTIYICNHQSWIDATTFGHITPASSLAKSQVKNIPLVGLLVIYAGGILFDRETQSSRLGIVKLMMKTFKDGVSVCLFPEGTRSRDGSLLKPNLSLVKLAYKMKIPVVPAALNGTRDIVQKGRPYFRFFRKVTIKYNPPMNPADYSDDESFAAACWDKVEQTYEEITKK